MGRRVLIVDDHAGFRRWARALLVDEGYDVVGEAANGAEAIDAARDRDPDAILLDVCLPDRDGFEVAIALAEQGSTADIVLVSNRDADTYGSRLARTVALGFIVKSELSAERLAGVLGGGD